MTRVIARVIADDACDDGTCSFDVRPFGSRCHQERMHPGSKMSLKAAECGLLLPFAMQAVQQFGGTDLHGPYLYPAGESLMQLMTAIRKHRIVVPAP
eukprot:3557945-Pyramimonas_sp.AAC.1